MIKPRTRMPDLDPTGRVPQHQLGKIEISGTKYQLLRLGAWSSSVGYIPGNLVTSGGSDYVCVLANVNQVPPNATYWQLFDESEYVLDARRVWARQPDSRRGWSYWFVAPLSDLGGGEWTKTIDSTVENNVKYVHAGANDSSTDFIFPVALAPGSWTPHWTMKVGAGVGTVTYYVAGAYDFQTSGHQPATSPLDAGSGDWIEVATRDLSSGILDTYWDDHVGLAAFSIDPDVPQYTQATSYDSGTTLLDGSSGTYFIRIAFDGDHEVTKIVLVHDSVRYKSTSG